MQMEMKSQEENEITSIIWKLTKKSVCAKFAHTEKGVGGAKMQ